MRLRLLATMALVFCARVLAGQQEPAAPPTFRADVDLVELGVRVTDSTGAFVGGLSAQDFEVVEDGTPQAVTTLSEVTIPIEPAEPLGARLPPDPDVRTNTPDPSRLYVIAMDEGITSEQILRARMFLRRFVEAHFASADIGAVVWVGRGLARDTQDLTSSKRLLLRAIDRFQGGASAEPTADSFISQAQPIAPPSTPGSSLPVILPRFAAENQVVSRTRMRSLRELTEFMASMRGRRKSLLYVTTGLGFDMFDVLDYQGGVMGLAIADAHAAMSAATRGDVTIYVIDPRGLSTDGTPADQEQPSTATAGTARRDLRTFAESTGGFAVTDRNNFDEAFTRIVEENSSYYILGFSPTNLRRDGRYRKLQVRVKRPGLSVQSRGGYMAPRGRPPRPPAPARGLPEAVAEALASPLSTPGLPMRVTAVPYQGSGGSGDVLLVVEADGQRLGLREKDGKHSGAIDITWAAVSADGRRTPGGHERISLALEPDTYERAVRSGVRFVSRFSARAGRYQLRVAAGGTTGPTGSVIADLEVPDFSQGPFNVSGLAITSRRADEAPTHQVNNRLERALPAPPSTRRDFDTGEDITVYAEVYPGRGSKADEIGARVVLLDETGAAIKVVGAERSGASRTGFVASLSFDAVPAGAYVLRFEAHADSQAAIPVGREIPIRVK